MPPQLFLTQKNKKKKPLLKPSRYYGGEWCLTELNGDFWEQTLCGFKIKQMAFRPFLAAF